MSAGSMENSLFIGDYLMVNKSAYGIRDPFTNKVLIPLGEPQRGDVAVFVFPPDQSKEYIKRIIGLQGDKIQIINKKLFINDEVYKNYQAKYALVIPPPTGSIESPLYNFGPVVVPPDSYFVLGDNQDHSYDSRFWGFVPFELIRGKALYVYFSQDQKDSRIRWNRIGKPIN